MMSATPSGLPVCDSSLPPFDGCDMPEQLQQDGATCSFGPLERFAALAAAAGQPIHPYAFMFMGTRSREGNWTPEKDGRIHLYKHVDTRRYLNLDDSGHAYRCEQLERADPSLPDADPERGCRYVAWASPAEAIAWCYS